MEQLDILKGVDLPPIMTQFSLSISYTQSLLLSLSSIGTPPTPSPLWHAENYIAALTSSHFPLPSSFSSYYSSDHWPHALIRVRFVKCATIHPLTHPPIHLLIHQSIHWSIHQYIDRSINPLIDRSIHPSIDQSINRSINQSINT